MPTKKLLMMRHFVLLSLSTLALSGCVTIQNRHACAVNDKIYLGATCAGTVTGETYQLTMDETLDLLEARPERVDPKNPTQKLPAHAPAVIQSADDYELESVELQEACRELGKRCSYATQAAIERRQDVLKRIKEQNTLTLP